MKRTKTLGCRLVAFQNDDLTDETFFLLEQEFKSAKIATWHLVIVIALEIEAKLFIVCLAMVVVV